MTDVRMPDGTIIKNVPDGITKSELMRRYNKASGIEPLVPETYSPVSDGVRGFIEGFGSAFADLALGTKQLAAMRGVGAGGEAVKQKLSNEVERKRDIDAPLLSTKRGLAGNIAGNVAAAVPTMAIPGANTVKGAGLVGSAFGLVQPASSDTERAVNTGAGALLGSAGQKAGDSLARLAGKGLASRAAKVDADRVAREPLEELLRESRQLGLVAPPATANPSFINRLLEGFAGKLTTGQGASVLNQSTFKRVAKEAVGIPKTSPLSKSALARIRKDAGKIYNDIAESGVVVADDAYRDALRSIRSIPSEVAQDFPNIKMPAADKIDEIVSGVNAESFDAASGVFLVRDLRNQASKLFKSIDDPEKVAEAFARRQAADALDDLILRHLQRVGADDLAASYKPARELIAKTHTIEAALDEAGNIDAKALAKQLGKGKPLSGDLELLARFADAVPKASRATNESFPGFSPLDYGFSGLMGGGALASGSEGAGVLAGLPLARAAIRRGILSGPAQNRLLTPPTSPGLIGNTALQTIQGIGRLGAPIGMGGLGLIEPLQE